jgi:uncharacterized membrane protein YhaH (DUF805 family)
MNWYLKALKQFKNYKGRARRKEFWMFTLFHVLIILVITLINFLLKYITNDFEGKDLIVQIIGTVMGIYILAMLIPSLSLTVRRLHDVDKSGWMILISFIPIIGGIWLLILMLTDSSSNENQYGVNPKEAS